MTDLITSTQNPRVKLVYSLQQRPRARRAERRIVLEGNRLLHDALQRGATPFFALYDPASADYELIAALQAHSVKLHAVAPDIMQHVSDTQQPQGVVGVFELPMPDMPRRAERVLILDGLREPGNLGTMLRTAAAADVQVVLLSPGTVDPYNPKVLRAGMGAHFRVPILEVKWFEIAGYCEEHGLSIYAATAQAEQSYSAADWTRPWALIVGNEAHGLSQQALNLPHTPLAIPMAAATESLNAATACAVMLFEAQRQRHA